MPLSLYAHSRQFSAYKSHWSALCPAFESRSTAL
jgi:hypothetical protein